MKRITSFKIRLFAAAFAALVPLATAQAGSFFADFNSGAPAGMTLYGASAIVQPSGGYTNSGYLQLTTTSSGNGTAILGDLDSGTPVVSFTAQFKVLIGNAGGYTADGMSFNFAPDLPAGPTISEEGAGTGYTVEFDTFNNGAPDTAPSIDVKVGGANGDHGSYTGNELAATPDQGLTPDTFVDCVIQLNPNNTLTVCYDGVYIYSNLDLSSTGYTPVGGSQFGFGARIGSLTENCFLDNLSLVTYTNGTPYVNSFLPQGRAVATNSPIDIVLTDNTTQVNTNTIVLTLDGITVSPSITTNGTGDTFIHYVKPGGFASSSTHSVGVTFSDNASQPFSWQYGFTTVAPPPVVKTFVDVFNDSFETYASASTATVPLDKNGVGANAAPNGSGNPWFGPAAPNDYVMQANGGVSPHSGTNMVRAHATSDFDELYYNLGYRLRSGNPLLGNFLVEWWFYDPLGSGGSNYKDLGGVGKWTSTYMPGNTDYNSLPSAGLLPDVSGLVELGAAVNQNSGFLNTKYQARVVNGTLGYNNGNANTQTTRSVGWHEARIVFGPPTNNSPVMNFYIDDMSNPTFTEALPYNGGNSLGINGMLISSGNGPSIGYFDDFRVALAIPPKLTPTLSGNTLSFTWPAGFTLQSALDVTGPYADVSTTYTGFDYDITSNPQQFFRLKN